LQREFLAPNLCAQKAAGASCTAPKGRIWTWRFDPKTATRWLDKSFALLLQSRKPISGGPGFGKRRGDVGDDALIPSMVVRYGTMTPDQYKGTVGKPGVHRTFFADYLQARSKTVRGFILATGSPDPQAALASGKSLFIWVYAPGPEAQSRARDLGRGLQAARYAEALTLVKPGRPNRDQAGNRGGRNEKQSD
jgi:hypothetical protein